jgi:hypothetical protein
VGLPGTGVAARSGPDYRVWPFHFTRGNTPPFCLYLHELSILGVATLRCEMLKVKNYFCLAEG